MSQNEDLHRAVDAAQGAEHRPITADQAAAAMRQFLDASDPPEALGNAVVTQGNRAGQVIRDSVGQAAKHREALADLQAQTMLIAQMPVRPGNDSDHDVVMHSPESVAITALRAANDLYNEAFFLDDEHAKQAGMARARELSEAAAELLTTARRRGDELGLHPSEAFLSAERDVQANRTRFSPASDASSAPTQEAEPAPRPTPAPPPAEPEKKGGFPVWAIVLIAVGGAIVIGGIVALVVLL